MIQKDMNPSRFYASDLLGPWGTSAGALFIISPEISMPLVRWKLQYLSILDVPKATIYKYYKYTSLVLFIVIRVHVPDENETVTLGWAWSTKFTKWQIKSSFEDIWLLSAMRTARSRASICQSAAWKCDECHLHRWYTVMLWLFSSNIICILYIYTNVHVRMWNLPWPWQDLLSGTIHPPVLEGTVCQFHPCPGAFVQAVSADNCYSLLFSPANGLNRLSASFTSTSTAYQKKLLSRFVTKAKHIWL